MKTILKANTTLILLSFFIFVSIIKLYAQQNGQWEILDNNAARIQNIDFVNDEVGWGIAGETSLLKTDDGGDTWNSIDIEFELNMIDFVDESVGWAIGGKIGWNSEVDKSFILKSIDGGQSWLNQKELGGLGTYGLFSVDDRSVYACGGVKIYKTSDGGINWIDVSPGLRNCSLESIWFFSSEIGIVSYRYDSSQEGFVLRTFDGGGTWYQKSSNDLDNIKDVQFINDTTGYFLTETEDDKQVLGLTSDTLNTWTIQYEGYNQIYSFHIFENNTLIAIMDDDSARYVMKSMDGGKTWVKKQEIYGDQLHFASADIGFIMVPNFTIEGGVLYKSIDGGETWKILKLTDEWSDVYFIDNNVGFISCGSNSFGPHGNSWGYQLITKDGGETWDININEGNRINSCQFVNDDEGYVLGSSYIYKTTDGGDNWTIVYSFDLPTSGNDISFINENMGWALVGAEILGTKDSGVNWIHERRYGNDLNSIHTYGNEAWAVGEGGLIIKYTNLDEWQVVTSVTDLPLRKVFFSDENNGWISGGYFDEDNEYLILLKSIDGGETWREIPDINYQINDMFFEDSLHGWAVGNDTFNLGGWPSGEGVILKTSNGGETWDIEIEGLPNSLNAIHFKDGKGWAVGEWLIFKYDGVTWIEETSVELDLPHVFNLSQNYPNPFNPKTIINYELPITNDVELSIYNLLGQKVATLVNEQKRAGYHQIEWDASGIASGIYYYRIEAGEFHDVKKMVLLR